MSGPAKPENLAAVVLAAGEGKRMKSDRAKVMVEVRGKALLGHVLDRVQALGIDKTVVIVGHRREPVIALTEARGAAAAVQEQQLGTGHAFRQAVPALGDFRGTVLVLCGDTPLLTVGTLARLLETHRRRAAAATVLSADLADPTGYGRVVRDAEGDIEKIVEDKDATPAERSLHEINTAIYAFEYPEITEVLGEIRAENRQGEYYLTDVVSLLRARGRRVAVLKTDDPREAAGINTVEQLQEAEAAYAALAAEGRL
ncbi:MAG TPA: NTP transferase domain-containing protein [Candidatus Eisenbacteria bacterium]|nr:NTP transferase domain-containing protein [Candidatus Eisenbacteria bacterium]